jgi:hypothetical protein
MEEAVTIARRFGPPPETLKQKAQAADKKFLCAMDFPAHCGIIFTVKPSESPLLLPAVCPRFP